MARRKDGDEPPAKPWENTSKPKATTANEAWAAEIERRLLADCHPAQRAFVEDPSRYITARVGRGGGKGLPVDEPVMTPGGERRIGDLRVGSRVCAPDGTLSHVIGVFPQGKRPTYELEFDDGAVARCDDQHIWAIHVQGRDRDKYVGRNKREIEGPGYRLMLMPEVLRRWRDGHRIHVPTLSKPAQITWKDRALPLEPYLFGLLLGDASLRKEDVRFVTMDSELADRVVAAGFKEHTPDKRNGLRTFRAPVRGDVYKTLESLSVLGKRSWEKEIPKRYRLANPESRLALIQGLMDTDGYIDRRGNTTFCSTSETLARGVQWLVRSLGGKATLRRKKTARRDAFTVYVQSGGKFVPFRLKRKADRYKSYQHPQLWRRIIAVRELGEQETVCIKVDHPTGLFITRDFVVTHNTTGSRARLVIKMAKKHKGRFAFITASRPFAEKLMWGPLKEIVFALGIEATFHETDLCCTFKRTGSQLWLGGADDKKECDKFRGLPWDEVVIDEVAMMTATPAGVRTFNYLLEQVIEPRLGERKGTLVLTSTPGNLLSGPFYDFTRPGAADDNGTPLHRPYTDRDKPEFAGWESWSSHYWSLDDPECMKIEALKNLREDHLDIKKRKGWSDDNPIWKREYCGIWAADDTDSIFKFRATLPDGTPWNEWDPPRDVKLHLAEFGALQIARLPMGPDGRPRQDWFYAIGMDLGSTDPTAINVFAASPSDPERLIYHIFCFEQRGMFPRTIAILMLGEGIVVSVPKTLAKPAGLIGSIGTWPTGIVADDSHLGKGYLSELKTTYGLLIEPAVKSEKTAAVEIVNGDLIDGKIKVLKGSHLASQLSTLQWSKDQFGFLKFPDKAEDHCLVAGTLVRTAQGEVPIEEVRAGDLVWTRGGIRRVEWAGQTGVLETFRVTFEDGRTIEGTSDHKIWTQDGWKELALLTQNDTVISWENTDHQKQSSSEAANIVGTLTLRKLNCGGTSLPATGKEDFIESNGRHCEVRSQPVGTCITKTATPWITGSRILRSSKESSTSGSMHWLLRKLRRLESLFSSLLSRLRLLGTDQKKEELGIRSTPRTPNVCPNTLRSVLFAEPRFCQRTKKELFAATAAPQGNDETAASMTSPKPVSSVASPSFETSTAVPTVAPLRVVGVEPTGCVVPVFDLTVRGDHEFFANGVLVHNSTDCLIYARKILSKLFDRSGAPPDPKRNKARDLDTDDEPIEAPRKKRLSPLAQDLDDSVSNDDSMFDLFNGSGRLDWG